MSYALDFICTHQKQAENYCEQIVKELPVWTDWEEPQKEKLTTARFTGIGTREPFAKRQGFRYESATLKQLATKISYMHDRGRAEAIPRMLKAIASGRIKKFRWKEGGESRNWRCEDNYWPIGHFRVGLQGFTLTEKELQRVREYFDM